MIGAVLKSILACLEVAYTINVEVLYLTVTKQFSLARSFFEDWQSVWISVILETLIACPIKNVCSLSRNLKFYDCHRSASILKNSPLHRLNLQEGI